MFRLLDAIKEAEISDQDIRMVGFATEDDILWVEVTVHQPLAVDVLHTLQQVLHYLLHDLRAQLWGLFTVVQWYHVLL
jgi:hypothetical protein